MTVRIGDSGTVELVGFCGAEDAEALLRRLSERPDAAIDWCACNGAHAAVVQVLIAAKACPEGPPQNRFLATFVAPLLKRR